MSKKIVKRTLESIFAGFMSDNTEESKAAGLAFLEEVKKSGCYSIKKYLNQVVDTRDQSSDFVKNNLQGNYKLSGYEASLAFLNLPLKGDKVNGSAFANAGNTFTTFPGTTALFPVYQEDVLRMNTITPWHADISEIVSSSMEVEGNQVQWDVADFNDADYLQVDGNSLKTFMVAEGASIPLSEIKAGSTSVKFYKHGAGYRFTYEFLRRAGYDILTPFLAAIQEKLSLSKVNYAVNMIYNGDGNDIGAVTLDLNVASTGGFTYANVTKWLTKAASEGKLYTTIVGSFTNYDKWLSFFTPNMLGANEPDARAANGSGHKMSAGIPALFQNVKFIPVAGVSETMIVGFNKNLLLQELTETGSKIQESENQIRNQTTMSVGTETVGYRFVLEKNRGSLVFA